MTDGHGAEAIIDFVGEKGAIEDGDRDGPATAASTT